MSGLDMIAAVGAAANLPAAQSVLPSAAAAPASDMSFASILAGNMRQVEGKIAIANDLVRQFSLDDSVPLHRVTYALEEARLSVELAMQVRGRLIESYRELMNMQL